MILRRLYSFWALFSFIFLFFLFAIPLFLCSPFRSLHKVGLKLNYLWALSVFRMIGLPIKKTWKFKLDKKQQYILCSNHFSYLDIPMMGYLPISFKFVGKNSLAKIPLFGYMYSHLHITVNRSSYRSRAQSFLKSKEALAYGFNLGFFPEGGILTNDYPNMVKFKDGAFKLAAEYNVPIMPISFPDNYLVLKSADLLNIRRTKCRIIYHEPIWAKGKSDADIRELKAEVFRVIQTTLTNSKT